MNTILAWETWSDDCNNAEAWPILRHMYKFISDEEYDFLLELFYE